MIHFFILFPIQIIFAATIWQLMRKYPENILFRYFTYFIVLWSACTIGVGAAETFSGRESVVFTTLAFVLPFLYIASSFLWRIPFALYQNEGTYSRFLVFVTIFLGIFYSLSILVMVQGWWEHTGLLQGIFTYMAQKDNIVKLPNVLFFHMITMLAIFLLTGAFFFREAFKTQERKDRTHSLLIGSGLIIVGIAEWYHVVALHTANRDFFLILGFFLVVMGLFYPTWVTPSRSYQEPSDISTS